MCQQPSLEADLKRKHDVTISPRDILSAALYPKVFDEYKYVSQACCKRLVLMHRQQTCQDFDSWPVRNVVPPPTMVLTDVPY